MVAQVLLVVLDQFSGSFVLDVFVVNVFDAIENSVDRVPAASAAMKFIPYNRFE
jgi:hypothetical protein